MPAKVKVDWADTIKPLLKKYKNTKHPLEYANTYQLLVMVVLSAQSTDVIINNIAPALFKAFPNMEALSKATSNDLVPFIGKVRNFVNKSKWLMEMSQKIKSDKNIPKTLAELTALPGIGRKSANVILREIGQKPEGVIVDLHVVRVAPRLGITSETDDPKKIEKDIMEVLPRDQWDAGMAMSFLGRDICRPKPKCEECLMRPVCKYYKSITKKGA